MARSVKDAAFLLQAIAGPDPNDNYTLANPHQDIQPDYVAACSYNALAGARIGVAWNVVEIWRQYTDQVVIDAFHEAIDQIRAAGATIVDANFTAFAAYNNSTIGDNILSADFLVDLPNYLKELTYNPNNIQSLADERNFTHNFPLEDWPERDTKIWDGALKQYNNTSPEFWPVYQQNLFYGDEGGILGALRRTNTSAVLLPTQLSPSIPALVGSPVVTVPMGFYPWNTTVVMNGFGNLVATGPNVPFGLVSFDL